MRLQEPNVKPLSLYVLLLKLWGQLRRKRRVQFVMLVALMVIASFTEVLSLGAIVPFLGVIAAPDAIMEEQFMQPFLNYFEITDASQLLALISILFCVSVISAAVFRTALLRLMLSVSYSSGSELSCDAFEKILNQPYLAHLNRNTSELITIMGPKLNNAVAVLNNVLIFLSSTIIAIGIFGILVAVQPKISLILFASFTAIYAGITAMFRARLTFNSKRIARLGPLLVKTLQESLGGIRNIILDNSRKEFHTIYKNTDIALRNAQSNTNFVSSSPRPIMEALGIVLIVGLAYSFSFRPEGVQGAIPILGFMALGAQRLLPSLQQAYAAWSFIRGEQQSLQDILEILCQPVLIHKGYPLDPLAGTFEFDRKINLKSVSFRFDDGLPWILKDFSLEISKGSWLGIIGETGSGKSTLIHILMGLLSPTKGKIYIDDNALSESGHVYGWQSRVAHVPQAIFLSDCSISENIAFGAHPNDIDHDYVRKCAKIAQISSTIDGLPDGYETMVGERGVRLSGGQRQRIGIARALYKRADIIIFDEATNALDTATENEVMEALENLPGNITVIMVAHRLSTLKNCSKVIDLSGSVESLTEASSL